MKQKFTELKGETDSNTIMVRNFNAPPPVMDRTTGWKINKKTEGSNNTYRPIRPDRQNTPLNNRIHSSPVHMEHSLTQTTC